VQRIGPDGLTSPETPYKRASKWVTPTCPAGKLAGLDKKLSKSLETEVQSGSSPQQMSASPIGPLTDSSRCSQCCASANARNMVTKQILGLIFCAFPLKMQPENPDLPHPDTGGCTQHVSPGLLSICQGHHTHSTSPSAT
jgi:hypothetical protein